MLNQQRASRNRRLVLSAGTRPAFLAKRSILRPQARHVASALVALVVIILLGGFILWIAGNHEYPLWECIYFALYTVSTVGYAELPHFANHPGIHLVVSALIVAGVGAIAFFSRH